MICKRCKKEIPDGSLYCNLCGAAQTYQRHVKGRRSNGEGTVVQLHNGTFRLTLTEYISGARVTRSKSGFKTKQEAYKYVPLLREQHTGTDPVTFRQAFESFIATHKRSKATIQCYSAAFEYFAPLHGQDLAKIGLEDLQRCMDMCDKGKRTKQNMRTICGLVYKFMIPRYPLMRDLNLGEFLKIYDVQDSGPRESFTPEQLEKIRSLAGTVPYADYILCQCYLGFRPSELLDLTRASYLPSERVFIGGSKTDAGKGRKVTVSPKILPLVNSLVLQARPYVFRNLSTGGKLRIETYREAFYKVLDAAGIENPVEDGRRRYSPHTCRHTFATMVKRVQDAPERDVLELIGHTDIGMTMDYQDVSFEDLRKITDAL